MQRDIVIKGKGLGGTSDLTLLAPIKPGFVDSLESVTYKTRIKRVLETLHGARVAAHEHAAARLLSDSVERVGAIHSVRVAVLEPEDKVLLAVTFDGSWESYVRVLWDKVGTLLDLIFCGTQDYVTSWDHSFEEWAGWARRVQVETGFFYAPPEATARDVVFQRRLENMRVRGADSELNEVRAVMPTPEETIRRLSRPRDDLLDEPAIEEANPFRMLYEQARAGLRGLAALYRLTDLHRPATRDGDVLQRATVDLLQEFVRLCNDGVIDTQLEEARARFARQLDWLFPLGASVTPPARGLPLPRKAEDYPPLSSALRDDIQGGILRSYDEVTHGLVVMLGFADARAVADFLDWLSTNKMAFTRDSDAHIAQVGTVFRNLAFTPAGLRVAGVGEDTLALFPEDFMQGMAARSGLIGDVRNNHPQRWHPPGRFEAVNLPPAPQPIELSKVHAMLQLRVRDNQTPAIELHQPGHPLQGEVKNLHGAGLSGVSILAVQSLRRRYANRNGKSVTVEHFGFQDGDGQPQVEDPAPPDFALRNRAHLGEIIIGHDNAVDTVPDRFDPSASPAFRERMGWLANGTFLVMRKYRQYPYRLEVAVEPAAKHIAATGGSPNKFIDPTDEVFAKLMGRKRDGQPLVPFVGSYNNFVYDIDDPQGSKCPLHAHVRLANPRVQRAGANRPPRLMRRSMSYGPVHQANVDDDHEDKGLLFMAYNQCFSEQYEVVQRWLNGGNSTGASSGQSCPIVGVPENGVTRHFRFERESQAGAGPEVLRVELENPTALFEEPAAPTRLEWGAYLFTPSLSAIRRLRAVAEEASKGVPAAALPWQLARGRIILATLRDIQARQGDAVALEAWKAAIEDPEAIDRHDSASLWSALRADHGGLLKTPYGTLVASRELQLQVLIDTDRLYSVCGQFERMKQSFGEISLGMDEGPIYHQQSDRINDAIMDLTAKPSGQKRVFTTAFDAATGKLKAIIDDAILQSQSCADTRFHVTVDAREVLDVVLGALCDAWFGLHDDPQNRFARGGADWAWKRGMPPPYPGHFTAMSRYMFQPHPGDAVVELGEGHGQALREAMNLFVADHRALNTLPQASQGKNAPIAEAIFTHPTHGPDNDFVARNMVGVLMGFNPTIIGAALNVLREWCRDGSIGALRAQLAGNGSYTHAHAVLDGPVMQAMCMRPMPQVAWRTALRPHRLGDDSPNAVDVAAGDKLVLAFVSGTQQSLADGGYHGWLMFGGDRLVKPNQPHPTHACPGREAGMEAIVGTLAALLTRSETTRQGMAPLSLVIEGDVPPVAVAGGAKARQAKVALHAALAVQAAPVVIAKAMSWKSARLANASFVAAAAAVTPGPHKITMMAWGDSWLDAKFVGLGGVPDMIDWLGRWGHKVLMADQFCDFDRWGRISRMSANAGEFCTALGERMDSSPKPQAILLSGGGNDSTAAALKALIRKKGAASVLDPVQVAAHVETLHTHYRNVLLAIEAEMKKPNRRVLPVIVHGYDDPVPKKRLLIYGLVEKKWLKVPFADMGYTIDAVAAPQGIVAQAMQDLIKAMNDMLAKLHLEFAFVHYVDLRKTIATNWTVDPTLGWTDDLHPTTDGFELLAQKADTLIQNLVATGQI